MVKVNIANRTLRRFGLFWGIALCLLVGLGGCDQSSSAASQQPSYSRVVTLDASWSVLYSDVKSAKAASDVVVLGAIASIKRVGFTKNDQGQDDGIVFTDYVFTIERTIVDERRLLKSPTILIHQTGGILDGTKYEIQDDPLFQAGEHALLFLHIYKSGYAFIVGGPSGRFLVQNGLVQPRSPETVMMSIRSRSVPVADFITQIQNA
ncbi:MAG TPA: hypothetical protein VH599_12260 [Ktedonobacterales bacterium]